MINGSLTGMVCICAGADRYYPWAASIVAGMYVSHYFIIFFFIANAKWVKFPNWNFYSLKALLA